MSKTYELRRLYDALTEDDWRKQKPFSDEIKIVNDLLFNTFASDSQREIHLLHWLQKFQPCMFGRIAAASSQLHFCFLTDADIQRKSDEEITAAIRESLRDWKRRSVRPTDDFSTPAHGFVLLICSHRVSHAVPDSSLRTFSEKIRQLWGCEATDTELGDIHWESLFLQNPKTMDYSKFQFTIDFFAAQGDGRWWQDHRTPGGIMFTANSVGYMKKYREWYKGLSGQDKWILENAMLTISLATKTEHGPATWLKTINASGEPLLKDLKCPFSIPGSMKPDLVGKDWTRYGGYLHTDHSIRPEFFHQAEAPSTEVLEAEYLQDFAYLYDPRSADNVRFVTGVPISEAEVIEKLGPIADWTRVRRRADFRKLGRAGGTFVKAAVGKVFGVRGPAREERAEIERLLSISESWTITKAELDGLSKSQAYHT